MALPDIDPDDNLLAILRGALEVPVNPEAPDDLLTVPVSIVATVSNQVPLSPMLGFTCSADVDVFASRLAAADPPARQNAALYARMCRKALYDAWKGGEAHAGAKVSGLTVFSFDFIFDSAAPKNSYRFHASFSYLLRPIAA